jgi:hypothetical protein
MTSDPNDLSIDRTYDLCAFTAPAETVLFSAICPDGQACEHEKEWAHPCDRDEAGNYECERIAKSPSGGAR